MSRRGKGTNAGCHARRIDEVAYQAGESLCERPQSLDARLAVGGASISTWAECDGPLPPAVGRESTSALLHQEWVALAAVKPLCDLALESFACVEAITASCIAGVPYTGLRDAIRFSDVQKAEIAEAVQRVAANHAAVFAAHKDTIELAVALTAMQAAKLDQVLLLAADNEPLSRRQVFGSLAIIFAPLLALLLLAWLKRLQAGA